MIGLPCPRFGLSELYRCGFLKIKRIMKRTTHPAVTGAGFSFVCCLGALAPLLSPNHRWIYHHSDSPVRAVIPLVITLLMVWLASTLLLLSVRKYRRLAVSALPILVLYAAWGLLKEIAIHREWHMPGQADRAIYIAIGLCWIGLMLPWRRSRLRQLLRIQGLSNSVLCCMAFCGFLAALQLMWVLAGHRPSPRGWHDSTAVVAKAELATRPRIIWIILDELSYQQLFENRSPTLNLPTFDRLANESTVFTHVVPAGKWTEVAVPSLMGGVQVDAISVSADGNLKSLHDTATGQWQSFRSRDTVFQDARSRGFHTAVAGWYNPYCRILAEVLDACHWTSREVFAGGLVSDATVFQNVKGTLICFLSTLGILRSERSQPDESPAAENHIADYREMVDAGDRLLENPSFDFLFLHVPIPHPGGIYDRRSGSFTTHGSSYVDNLALADLYLAHVRQILEQHREWDTSAVIVMGDHSWRTQMIWKNSPFWTPEDEAASRGGEFDDRPAYIVKLPHQTEAAKVEASFPAVRTRALLDGILDGRIRTVPELTSFVVQPPMQDSQSKMLVSQVEGATIHSHGR